MASSDKKHIIETHFQYLTKALTVNFSQICVKREGILLQPPKPKLNRLFNYFLRR